MWLYIVSLGVKIYLTPFLFEKVATKTQLLRYSGMIQKMIQNLLGDYSKYIQLQNDGNIKVFVPEDINNPSLEKTTEITLSSEDAIKLMSLVTQTKQYETCYSANNCRIITENDPEFDLNKWIKLAINTITNK